jgi:hypothetical protein
MDFTSQTNYKVVMDYSELQRLVWSHFLDNVTDTVGIDPTKLVIDLSCGKCTVSWEKTAEED